MSSDQEDIGVNPSANPMFHAVLEASLSRRDVLHGGLGAAALAVLGLPTPPQPLPRRRCSRSRACRYPRPTP